MSIISNLESTSRCIHFNTILYVYTSAEKYLILQFFLNWHTPIFLESVKYMHHGKSCSGYKRRTRDLSMQNPLRSSKPFLLLQNIIYKTRLTFLNKNFIAILTHFSGYQIPSTSGFFYYLAFYKPIFFRTQFLTDGFRQILSA